MSVKFLSAILGPEMAAPIAWAPGKMRSFCRKNHVHKIRPFRGGSADFIFMGARIFLTISVGSSQTQRASETMGWGSIYLLSPQMDL